MVLAAYFPYISPLLIENTDLQPLCFLISVTFVSLWPKDSRINGGAATMLVLLLAALMAGLFAGGDSLVIRKSMAPIMGLCIYCAASALFWRYDIASVAIFGQTALVFVVLLQALFPEVLAGLSGHIYNRVSTDASRGLTGLASEPSHLAINLALGFFVLYWANTHSGRWRLHGRFCKFIALSTVACLLATKSGTGLIMLTLGVLPMCAISAKWSLAFVGRMALAVGALTIVILAFYVQEVQSDNNRAVSLVMRFSSDPITLITQDASVLNRMLGLLSGVSSTLRIAPLGTWGATFPEGHNWLAVTLGMDRHAHAWKWAAENNDRGGNSELGRFIAMFGLFSPVFFAAMVTLSFGRMHTFWPRTVSLFGVLMAISLGVSLGYPLIWILLASMKQHGRNFSPFVSVRER